MVPQSVQLSTYSENNIFKTCISTKMDQQIMKIYHSKLSVCFSIQNNINNQTFFLFGLLRLEKCWLTLN